MWIMREAVSLYNLILTMWQWIGGNVTPISGCGFWRGAADKFYAFAKQLMGGAPLICLYTEMLFTTKVGSWEDQWKEICGYAKSH